MTQLILNGQAYRACGGTPDSMTGCCQACGARVESSGGVCNHYIPVRAPEEIVDGIVQGLFQNVAGQQADRLVLTARSGLDLGGWCRNAVRDQILKGLRNA